MKGSFLVPVVAALLLLSCPATADTVNLGLVAFDNFIPVDPAAPGVNGFSINNFTGSFAIPPDFPTVDSLTFENSALIVATGTGPQVVPLGPIGPGSPFLATLLFPDNLTLLSASFSARLSQATFLLSDGTSFTAASRDISITLLPSSGPYLIAGSDFAVISVSNVPEPATWLLLSASCIVLWAARRRNLVPNKAV